MNKIDLTEAQRHAELHGYEYPAWWGLGFLIDNEFLLIDLLKSTGHERLARSLVMIMRVINPEDVK